MVTKVNRWSMLMQKFITPSSCNSSCVTKSAYLDDTPLDGSAVAVWAEPEACVWHLLIQAGSMETMSTAITQQKVVLRLSEVAHLAFQSVCRAQSSDLCQ